MDQIVIKNLEIFAHHGVYEEEQKLGQKFVVSLVLYTDLRTPGATDQIGETINYGVVARQVTQIVQRKKVKLLECVAEDIAHELLVSHASLKKITVTVNKPWAPVGLPLDTVGVEITRGWHTAYIGIGSNLGDRKAFLEAGLRSLSIQKDIRVDAVSEWIWTAPYGVTEQPPFLNGAIRIKTLLTPYELLDIMQAAENEAGRERTIHWGPRTLDLDLLFYDDETIGSERLIVPHPEIEKRRFVLQPLAQIAPWLRHPVTRKTVRQMLEELNQAEKTKTQE